MGKRILLIGLLLIPVVFFAQRKNRYKYEWCACIGATGFLGDLGGANGPATHFVRDLDFNATRYSLGGAVRRKYSSAFSMKASLYFVALNGSDANTQEFFRNNRNLHFRTQAVEFSLMGEFYLIKERTGHLYRINNVRQPKKAKYQIYVFAGIGGLYFNPQGKFTAERSSHFNFSGDGKWYNLRPLRTEGQGLPGGPDEYSPLTLVVPVGLGWKYAIDRKWSIGVEYGARYTFSNYIDDVGGTYYLNREAIRTNAGANGNAAYWFADPSKNQFGANGYAVGEKRGDKHNDAYMLASVCLYYKILYRKRTKSKF